MRSVYFGGVKARFSRPSYGIREVLYRLLNVELSRRMQFGNASGSADQQANFFG